MVDLISHKSTLQMDAVEKMARMLQFQEYFQSEVPPPEHRPWMHSRLVIPEGQNILNLVPSSMLVQGGSITMTNEQGGVVTITVTGDSSPRTGLSTFSPVKINLDKENYDTMIKDLEFNEKFADTSCAICQEDFKNKEDLKITPCEHIFHPKCISTWLEKECTRPTCPSCRHDCREKLDNDSKPR